MVFKVDEEVEPLDYDLGKYGGKGTIPEPTDADIEKVQKAFQKVAEDLNIPVGEQMTGATMAEVTERLGDDATEVMREANRRIYQAVSDLCKGTPSLEELEGLPVRVRNAFIGWLMGQFRPEASTADSKG